MAGEGTARDSVRDGRHSDPEFPERPGFYRHVLDRCPTPIVVVDQAGFIVYANEALMELSGYSKLDGLQTSIFDYVHPDDVARIADAFMLLAQQDPGQAEWNGRPWAPIHVRMIGHDGATIPVEIRGRDASDLDEVAGVVYEVRPAHEREILQRVLTGVASRGPGEPRLDLVMDLLSSSPLDIAAAILELHDSGTTEVITTTSAELGAALERAAATSELDELIRSATSPEFVAVTALGGGLGAELVELGLVDGWRVDVVSPAPRSAHRLIGFTPVHHVPATGVIDALTRAAELASLVLLRSRTEELLEHAARHDELTALPNRRGLLDGAETIAAREGELAVLFVDLDGFKAVNDRYGHATGDVVLRELAERMRAAIRPSDLVARLGGDEFAVVVASDSGDELEIAVPSLAERIIEVVDDPVHIDQGVVSLSASVGYVVVDAEIGIEAALESADRAMYVAKRAGGAQAYDGTV